MSNLDRRGYVVAIGGGAVLDAVGCCGHRSSRIASFENSNGDAQSGLWHRCRKQC